VNIEKLKFLLALQENPVAPASFLAKQVDVTPPTARAWLDNLREERVYISVQANIWAQRIGLETDDFLLKVDSYDSLQKIEKFCEVHPYTSYRARVFGGNNQSIMVQFRQPDEARKYLLEALEKMKKSGIVTHISEIPTLRTEYGSTFTRPRLDAWNPEKMTWEFDWDKWWKALPKSAKPMDESITEKGDLQLDFLDAQILQHIHMNARRKNTEIIESMGLDKSAPGLQQKVSSRLKRLKDEVIESYRVFINWTHFDVYNTPLIIAKCDSRITDRLIKHLSSSNFPFGSTIRKTHEGFVWSARLPSGHLSELVAVVWRIADSFDVLIIDFKHSQVYGLWAEAFDKTNNKWRSEKEFCLDTPLKAIGLKS
jgi:DNA-binding Lrp family transcriptional regulator